MVGAYGVAYHVFNVVGWCSERCELGAEELADAVDAHVVASAERFLRYQASFKVFSIPCICVL